MNTLSLLTSALAIWIDAVYHAEVFASGQPSEALLVMDIGPALDPLWFCAGAPAGWSISLQQLLAGPSREAAVPVSAGGDPARGGELDLSCWSVPATRGPFAMAIFELTPPADARGVAELRWRIGWSPGTQDLIRTKSDLMVVPMTEEQLAAGLPEASLVWGRNAMRRWRDEEDAPPAPQAPASAREGCLKGGCDGWGQLDVMVQPDGSRHEGAWSGSSPVNYGVDRAPDGRVTLAGFWSEGAVAHPAQPASYEALGQAAEIARALAPLCAHGADLRRFQPVDVDEFSHAHPVAVPGVAARTTLWTPGSSNLRVEAGQLALLVDLTDQPGDPQRAIAACSGAFAGLAGAESSWRATSFRSPPCTAVLEEGAADEEPVADAPPRVELTVSGLGDEIVLRCGAAP